MLDRGKKRQHGWVLLVICRESIRNIAATIKVNRKSVSPRDTEKKIEATRPAPPEMRM
jgi:hypothetical protein